LLTGLSPKFMNILFAGSEVWPLIKTGGLGDVAYALPHALQKQGADLRLIMPAYQDVMNQLDGFKVLTSIKPLNDQGLHPIRLLEAHHPQFEMPLWLIDSQGLFDRPGNPYGQPDGHDWPDNAERFATFAHAVAQVACAELDLGWQADAVHCNDWQTGLVPAFMSMFEQRPKTVFTVHNLAYGGYFSKDEFSRLGLPWEWWNSEGVEFYGEMSMLKAGLVYAEAITTVSPTYAEEICTPAFGYGMDGVLTARRHKLSGILNGIDTQVWNPQIDPLIADHYSIKKLAGGKRNNKKALLKAFGRKPVKAMLDAPLLGMVGRMVEQKGVDLILQVIPALLNKTDANLVVIGSGDEDYARQFMALAEQHPERVMVHIGYSEQLAHLLEAGSDLFLMPSRFEPCGLNQMYSMRYGTPPIVTATGGLKDTVCDASTENLDKGCATGFVCQEATSKALYDCVIRAISLYQDKPAWRKLQKHAMAVDFDWANSAQQYLKLYHK